MPSTAFTRSFSNGSQPSASVLALLNTCVATQLSAAELSALHAYYNAPTAHANASASASAHSASASGGSSKELFVQLIDAGMSGGAVSDGCVARVWEYIEGSGGGSAGGSAGAGAGGSAVPGSAGSVLGASVCSAVAEACLAEPKQFWLWFGVCVSALSAVRLTPNADSAAAAAPTPTHSSAGAGAGGRAAQALVGAWCKVGQLMLAQVWSALQL